MAALRRGRPPLTEGERLIPLTTTVPPDFYDGLCAEAARRGESVSAFARELMQEAARARGISILKKSGARPTRVA